MVIEQALYSPQPGRGWLAWSPGFSADWRSSAERISAEFGTRTGEESCPLCVFALPFVGRLVTVVQAADREDGLLFRFLVLPRRHYRDLGGDPFHLVDQVGSPPWEERNNLPSLPDAFVSPSPRRLVPDIQRVLDVTHGPTLLGGVQALLDGGRLVFERRQPAEDLVRSLWALLPTSTRADLWPASFAFGNALHFHVVVVLRASGPDYEHYITEEKAGDYPEGNYERALQGATETGDQAELDRLFSRRSLTQTFWLVVILLAGFLIVSLFLKLQSGPDAPAPSADTPSVYPTQSAPEGKEPR
jgi:hypothetical protein